MAPEGIGAPPLIAENLGMSPLSEIFIIKFFNFKILCRWPFHAYQIVPRKLFHG